MWDLVIRVLMLGPKELKRAEMLGKLKYLITQDRNLHSRVWETPPA